MKRLLILVAVSIIGMAFMQQSNTDVDTENETFAYADNIKFNHLFVVIDDSTYKYLFDSVPFFQEFAYFSESDVDAVDESWSGKYIYGNQDYLEIFKPGGADGAELGDFGIGFMPNKKGLLDSLHAHLIAGSDSIETGERTMAIDDENTVSWFDVVHFHDPDSLAISLWAMEYSTTFMQMAGFTEEDLKREISQAEISQKSFATQNSIPLDSVQYERLYERVTALSLNLSEDEYHHLSKYLNTFGFEEAGGSFKRPDLTIKYQLSEAEHSILAQIDFELRREVESQSYTVHNLTLSAGGKRARMVFDQH
jgi:hypothetical protein